MTAFTKIQRYDCLHVVLVPEPAIASHSCLFPCSYDNNSANVQYDNALLLGLKHFTKAALISKGLANFLGGRCSTTPKGTVSGTPVRLVSKPVRPLGNPAAYPTH